MKQIAAHSVYIVCSPHTQICAKDNSICSVCRILFSSGSAVNFSALFQHKDNHFFEMRTWQPTIQANHSKQQMAVLTEGLPSRFLKCPDSLGTPYQISWRYLWYAKEHQACRQRSPRGEPPGAKNALLPPASRVHLSITASNPLCCPAPML